MVFDSGCHKSAMQKRSTCGTEVSKNHSHWTPHLSHFFQRVCSLSSVPFWSLQLSIATCESRKSLTAWQRRCKVLSWREEVRGDAETSWKWYACRTTSRSEHYPIIFLFHLIFISDFRFQMVSFPRTSTNQIVSCTLLSFRPLLSFSPWTDFQLLT